MLNLDIQSLKIIMWKEDNMQENNKSYRIHTDIREDKFLNVNINQDIEQLEKNKEKLEKNDIPYYRITSTDYYISYKDVTKVDETKVSDIRYDKFIPFDNTVILADKSVSPCLAFCTSSSILSAF